MGNSSSSNIKPQKDFDNFYDIIDYIATYYILTMDFKSLSKLSEKAYCDKLVILTSDIIERYFNDMQITFLAQRIKDGAEVNELKTENVRFINQDNLESLDVSNDTQKSIRKKRVCIGIAKFYVKIAHLFAAIVMTINPVYTYKDATGQTVKTTLLEKDKIPKGVNRKLYKLNICDNRIRALKRGEQVDETTGDVTIQPRVCDMNLSKSGTEKTLADEPGITELMRLYLDDNYDYSNGTFTGMSKDTEKQFFKDLKLFYTTFTGNETMPDDIKKFSDIKLKDYSKNPSCQPPISAFNQKYTLNKKSELFVKYADNIKQMIQGAADRQHKLLSIINEIFTYVIDPYTGKRVIRIHPKLNDASLQDAIVKTRKFIVDLYINCENDYVNGVKIFEAIVESKILETTQKQIDNLKKEATKIIKETKKASQPVKENIPPVVIAGPNTASTQGPTTPTPTPNSTASTQAPTTSTPTPNSTAPETMSSTSTSTTTSTPTPNSTAPETMSSTSTSTTTSTTSPTSPISTSSDSISTNNTSTTPNNISVLPASTVSITPTTNALPQNKL